MQDEFDNEEMGMPDDDLISGSGETDLGDMGHGGEADAESHEGEDSGHRASGGARARAAAPRKAAAKPARGRGRRPR